jgi:predicted ABC-type ATPase
MPKKQRIIIIAGPNGAGKTTFAREYLLKEAHCPDFINVDLMVDMWEWYDNSAGTPQLISAGRNR